jgi:hypothetical protein
MLVHGDLSDDGAHSEQDEPFIAIVPSVADSSSSFTPSASARRISLHSVACRSSRRGGTSSRRDMSIFTMVKAILHDRPTDLHRDGDIPSVD